MSNSDLSFQNIFKNGALKYNPVLVQCVGLCSVITGSENVKYSLLTSAFLFLDVIITCVIASLFLKKVPRYLRVALYLLIGLLIVCPLLYVIEVYSVINLSLGIKVYLCLISVGSITALHCEQFSVKNSVKVSFFDAISVCIGTSLIIILCGIFREIFGSGTFLGIDLGMNWTLSGFNSTCGCLLFLGLLSALIRALKGGKNNESSH